MSTLILDDRSLLVRNIMIRQLLANFLLILLAEAHADGDDGHEDK